MKKYLIVETEEITDAQKDGKQVYAYYEDEIRRVYFYRGQWLDCETDGAVEPPKFYLPNELPTPEELLSEVECEVVSQTSSKPGVTFGGDFGFQPGDRVMVRKVKR